MPRKRVLITGAAGLIGTLLRRSLAEHYELSGIDRQRIPGFSAVVADMAKMGRKAVRAFEGQDVVIDLTDFAALDTPWKVVQENNLPAAMNALEAARSAGVRRLIYASSNHVTGLYERDEPYASIARGDYSGLDPASIPLITTEQPIRPDGPYALGKVFGEAAGRYYADEHGLSVLCLRIGACNPSGRPENPRQFASLLSHGDLTRLIVNAVEAPESLRFGVYYGVSANTWRFWDLANARRDLGYTPEDNAEHWRGAAERP
jgi:uronate dehydrogenase